ncbi:MAG TPA: UTRA domain-containing protein, partial [Candidatus Baltobacteraceae bacterium]|nr:UTRA domain-containing protein [Candidatus Baltobacteraceae bacterium]
RLVDGQIVGLEVRYFPLRIGEALTQAELESQPLVPAMRRILGRTHDRLDLRVTAGVARGREATRLGVRPGAPMLIRENTWYLDPEGPIQYGRSVYRGDRYQMALAFTSWPQGGPDAGPSR